MGGGENEKCSPIRNLKAGKANKALLLLIAVVKTTDYLIEELHHCS
jgi:hypothetical protein